MENFTVTIRTLMVLFTVSAILIGCGPTQRQALNPIGITETDEGFIITEADEKIMSYQRQHKSINGKYSII